MRRGRRRTIADARALAWAALYRAGLSTREIAARLTRTVVALHAIIEGRTEPPTDAEIVAHCATGGRWRSATPAYEVSLGGAKFRAPARSHEVSTLPGAQADKELHVLDGVVARWWPLDADGRPCEWPVVTDGAP